MQNSKSRQIQTHDVFVGNLPPDVDQKKVSKYFTKYGEIFGIVVRDSNTEGKKLAYVKFLCPEDAEKAIAECQNIKINGNKMIVRKAESRRKVTGDKFNKEDGESKPKLFRPKSDHGNALHVSGSQGLYKDSVEETVMVTHVESANSLWIQVVTSENMEALMTMCDKLQEECTSATKISGVPELNKLYGAQFSLDQQWYRCRVKQSLGTDRVKVIYVDYGNTEELSPCSLVDISPEVSQPKPFAIRILFSNIRVADLHDKKAINYIKSRTEQKYLQCVLKRKLTDQTGFYAELYLEGECLNDRLVEEGFASARLEMKRRDVGFVPAEREMGGGFVMNAEKGGGDTSFLPRQNFDDMSRIQASLSSSGRSTPNNDPNNIGSTEDLRPELNARNQELQKVKFEREKLNGELTNLRSRMKVLQNEYASVSSKTVNHQFHMVMDMARKVKKLRCQFPTLQKTPLDEGLDLCINGTRIQNGTVKSLPDVLECLTTYRKAQKEICLLTDMAALDSLIEGRNTARAKTVGMLNVCVKELESLPLQEREKSVQETIGKLRKYYDTYFKFSVPSCPPIDTVLPKFLEWKQKRMNDFREARERTNSHQEVAVMALNKVQAQISFDNTEPMEQENVDLEDLLKNYLQSMQHEISVTDAEQSSDASFLAALVQSLYKELQSEMGNIENLQRLQLEFITMKTECEPWLSRSPSTEELLGVRKTLRGLKSKLRHRIADRQDLEENEGDSNELEELKKDINTIRTEIHEALCTENKLVTDLAKIADGHFPELMKLHPEMGIDIHLEYGGVVKPSQEVDHFELTAAEYSSQGLYTSTFSGSPIFIQEHLLSDGDRLDKDEFMQQLVLYRGLKHDNLQSVKAVFFHKNMRHAYVCTPRNGELLSSIIQKGNKPSQLAVQGIIWNIAKALQCLHGNHIVHGEVTPQNVLIKDDGTAVLLEPDFSLTSKERSRKKYVTPSGMAFVPPELKNATLKDVFPATDMYNLGLMLLWLHHPEVNFAVKSDAPDYTSVPLEKSVQILLSSLLNNLPHLRVTTDMMMTAEYMQQPVQEVEPKISVEDNETEKEPETNQQPEIQHKPVPEYHQVAPLPEHHYQTVPLPEHNHQTVPLPEHNHQTVPLPEHHHTVPLPEQHQTVPLPEQHQTVPLPEQHQTVPLPEHNHQTVPLPQEVDVMANIGTFEASMYQTVENETSEPAAPQTPGLIDLLSGRSSPASPENVNLTEVLRGFSSDNSFIKGPQGCQPCLAVLLGEEEPMADSE